MCKNTSDLRFSSLGTPERIWAISSVHSEVERLAAVHDVLYEKFKPGDRIIYLGNYRGYGADPVGTIDEILTFRRIIMSIPGVISNDITYLRGGQEEMLQKLMQLQFAPDPVNVFLWMLGQGLSATLKSYDLCPHDGIAAAKEGVMGLTRWTNKIRKAIRSHPGHEIFDAQLRRAAFVSEEASCPVLFVNAGLDPAKPLDEQGDNLWWGGENFKSISVPYAPYKKVVRGFDPNHKGMDINCVTATLDGGCGFGGSLVCAGFDRSGEIFEVMES